MNNNAKKNKELYFRTNNQIRSTEVRLVGDNVTVDIYSIQDALKLADDMELDLIEINSTTTPPICKIMDYGKFLYEQKKKLREKEKKNKENKMDTKELRFGPNTDEHDFEFKKRHAINFLHDGDKVRATVFFKGREMNYRVNGETLLKRLIEELSDCGIIENALQLEGNKLSVTIKPKK
jgi:translation initiation factor IF-3